MMEYNAMKGSLGVHRAERTRNRVPPKASGAVNPGLTAYVPPISVVAPLVGRKESS